MTEKKKEGPVHFGAAPGADAADENAARVDVLFSEPRSQIQDFRFDHQTASVFDDMVSRSVPFYHEVQRMVGELAGEFAVPGTKLYDLGCATGTTFGVLDAFVHPDVRFIGVDNSEEMLHQARLKLESLQSQRNFELTNVDLHYGPLIEDASVVIMVLTLQFLRPLHRERVLRRIYDGLGNNGCLILVEKLTTEHTLLNRIFIKYYYAFKKRNAYSEVEISQKREALENVLIPYRYEENYKLLHEVGFPHVEEFFRWYNFCAMIAVK